MLDVRPDTVTCIDAESVQKKAIVGEQKSLWSPMKFPTGGYCALVEHNDGL